MTAAQVERIFDASALPAAAAAVQELLGVSAVLERHGLPTGPITRRVLSMLDDPVSVRCYICRRRRVVVHGIASQQASPVCDHCQSAGCDRTGCYIPAAVAFDAIGGTRVYCRDHGLDVFTQAVATHSRFRIRHIVDGAGLRAINDARLDTLQRRRTAGAAA